MGVRRSLAQLSVGVCLALASSLCANAQTAPLVGAGQTQVAAPAAASSAPVDKSYILGPEDVVEFEVLGRSDFKTRAKIAQDGTILLPYLGSVSASDRTTQQLAEEVTRALEQGGFFSHPILRVEVVSFASRYVTVLGAVGTPGLVPINKPYRLSEILARVGGIGGNSADYVVVRPEQGPEQRYSIKALVMGDISQDPYVEPGDKIFLPAAEIFYISGQIGAPGQYPLGPDMTLRMAVAKAGGVTQLGSLRRIKINRGGKKVSGRIDLDAKVQAGDVIEIGERIF